MSSHTRATDRSLAATGSYVLARMSDQDPNKPKRDALGRLLPGVSGNPNGRPKSLVGMIKEKTNDGAELIDLLLATARDRKDTRHVEAARELLNRGWGKAVETLLNVDVDATGLLEDLPPDALSTVLTALLGRSQNFDRALPQAIPQIEILPSKAVGSAVNGAAALVTIDAAPLVPATSHKDTSANNEATAQPAATPPPICPGQELEEKGPGDPAHGKSDFQNVGQPPTASEQEG